MTSTSRALQARIGLASAFAVTVSLILLALWSFGHPDPCTALQPHCDSEFADDPTFRALSLGMCVVAGLVSGAVSWAASGFVLAALRIARRGATDGQRR
ncbi:hypothetical protein FGE12_29590 [Aggregicoccus sp. 17bor-14]|uniref:hypothetical protein n=1 Tax=Myxococcaceae TaxID=31 RepID=UPI00129D0BA9|nr:MULTISPECIES: hypothetical protein [Myxococcaceae]MBF5046607.1 hypothetical protein [Simulacricoccus sp. 17bor-14]MRI92318.1 hypothetical protein [Aggregicoccus sp. 17bor-14]